MRKRKKTKLKRYGESDLKYDSSFHEFSKIKKFNKNSFETKHNNLVLFNQKLYVFSKVKPQKPCTEEKKYVHKNATELHNTLLGTYFDEYMNFLFSKIKKFRSLQLFNVNQK